MRAMLVAVSMVGFLFAIGACGVPQEQYDALDKEFKTCKDNLGKTKGKLDSAVGERDKLKNEVDELAKKKAKLLKEMKKEGEELKKARAAAEARERVYKQLMGRLQSMINAGKITVKPRKGRLVVQMSDKILFDPGKTKLKDDGKAALKQLAAVLKDVPDRDFLVAGHTDNVPIKTKQFRSNWELSAARGVEVVKFLQEEGVDPKHLASAGYSEHDPVGDNGTDDGKKSNRRIEIVLMPNIDELPAME